MSTRTRNRGSVGTPYLADYWSCTVEGANPFRVPGVSSLLPGFYSGQCSIGHGDDTETITDEVSTADPRYATVIHPCSHVRAQVSNDLLRDGPYHITLYDKLTGSSCGITCIRSAGSFHRRYYVPTTLTPDSGVAAIALAQTLRKVVNQDARRMLVSLYELQDIRNSMCRSLLTLLKNGRVKNSLGEYVPFFGVAASDYRSRNLPKRLVQYLNVVDDAFGFTGYRLPAARRAERVKAIAFTPIRVLNDLVSLDLEWKFMIKPLWDDYNHLRSVYGNWNANAMAKLAEPVIVRGKSSRSTTSDNGPVTTVTVGPHANIGVRERISCATTTTTTVVYGVRKYLDIERIPSLDQAQWELASDRLGLNARVSDAYQVIPLSFVADWFYPVSDFLGQFEVPAADVLEWFVQKDAWVSTSVESITTLNTNITIQEPMSTMYSLGTERGSFSRFISSRKKYTRDALSQLPGIADVPLYWPHLRMPSSLGKWITGMELIFSGLYAGQKPGRRTNV